LDSYEQVTQDFRGYAEKINELDDLTD